MKTFGTFLLSFLAVSVQGGIWEDSGVVPDLIPVAPKVTLQVVHPNGIKVTPNMTLALDMAYDQPHLSWPADPRSLYTVVYIDPLSYPEKSKERVSYLNLNIAGNYTFSGETIFQYQPPAHYVMHEEAMGHWSVDQDPVRTDQRFLWLVYEQKQGRITDVPRETVTCSKPGLHQRLQKQFLSEFVATHNLGNPVAGNFHHTGYTEGATERLLCLETRCRGEPEPMPLPGVNDLPECHD